MRQRLKPGEHLPYAVCCYAVCTTTPPGTTPARQACRRDGVRGRRWDLRELELTTQALPELPDLFVGSAVRFCLDAFFFIGLMDGLFVGRLKTGALDVLNRGAKTPPKCLSMKPVRVRGAGTGEPP